MLVSILKYQVSGVPALMGSGSGVNVHDNGTCVSSIRDDKSAAFDPVQVTFLL